LGTRALGIDIYLPGDQATVPVGAGSRLIRHDLADPLPAEVVSCGPFELALCWEVAEHLPPTAGDRLVGSIRDVHPTRLVFTAAIPGQGGHGHINEQPPEYWRSRFDAVGLRWEPHETERLRA